MTSCDPHMPVSVYPSPCHFPDLSCLFPTPFSAVISGFILNGQKSLDLIVLWLPGQRARMCSYEWGRGSPVTKLADEACDLFKGMPKSQHQNKLEQRINRMRQKIAMTFKKKKKKKSMFLQ